jgi:ABC-type transporter Mla subunit MlaD
MILLAFTGTLAVGAIAGLIVGYWITADRADQAKDEALRNAIDAERLRRALDEQKRAARRLSDRAAHWEQTAESLRRRIATASPFVCPSRPTCTRTASELEQLRTTLTDARNNDPEMPDAVA